MKKIIITTLCSIFISGCVFDEDKNYCPDIEPTLLTKNADLFAYVEQDISSTSSGNLVAVSCHNCYDDTTSDISVTSQLINSALNGQADIIELDVLFDSTEINSLEVRHDNKSTPLSFNEIINLPELVNSSQLLFVEVKGQSLTEAQARALLDNLRTPINRYNETAYFNASRFTFIRSFDFDNVLYMLQQVLNEPEYADILPFVRLSRLTYAKSQDTMFAEIEQAAECGFDMVEVNQEIGGTRIASLAEYAKSVGLLVNVFTLSNDISQKLMRDILPVVDVITVEPDRDATTQTIFEEYKAEVESR